MKRLFFILLFVSLSTIAWTQNELPNQPVLQADNGTSQVKQYGEYLLDMRLLKLLPTDLPHFISPVFNIDKDYSSLIHLKNDIRVTQVFTDMFSHSNYISRGISYLGFSPLYNLYGFNSSPDYMQMGTIKLNNGMKLNVYGQYNIDGYKVKDPSLMPWQKNDFKGAFELKTANGSFGIRVEVNRSHDPFPY